MHLDHRWRVALLSALPAAGAALGAALDESTTLGVSTWRSACRAGGVSFVSVIQFTWQLLPLAITGALLGGLAVLALGLRWRRHTRATECLAAHAGCMIAMPLAMLACALAMPLALMPVVDALMGALAALLFLKLLRPRAAAAHP
jgi:hypothetical protein